MTDTPIHRIAAKFFLTDPAGVHPPALIPVFHEWIRRGLLPGLTIDVADYSHVPDGPGVMLIGHEWDRSLDLGDGRPGILVVAKRGHEGDLEARVASVVAEALRTAVLLSSPEWAGPAAAVRTDEVEITILDRLAAPNTVGTLDGLGGRIAAALARANAGVAPALEPRGDERRPFRVRARLAGGQAAELAAALVPAEAAA